MRLVFNILLSVGIALAILFLLELMVRKGLYYNKDHKISYIQKHTINADIVINGPCESEQVVNPAIVNRHIPLKIYNLSNIHSDLADNYLFMHTYLKNQVKPKLVLLYISPEMFDSSHSNLFNTYRFSGLLQDKEVRTTTKEMDSTYSKHSIVPFLRYSYYSNFVFYKSLAGWIQQAKNDTITKWPNGYVPPFYSHHVAPKQFAAFNEKETTFQWSITRVNYFIKQIELLQKNNIKVICYETPLYYEVLPLQKNRKEILKKLDLICSTYNVPYYRFENLQMQYDLNNYWHSDNTTYKGSEAFSDHLGRFLRDSIFFRTASK